MFAWLLLALTCACAWLTFDAFRMGAPMGEAAPRFWPKDWKTGQDHLTLAEQDRRQRVTLWSSLGLGWLAWTFLVMTVLLAILTVSAFTT